MESRQEQSGERVVQISLLWVALGVVGMVLLGMVGGMLASQWWSVPRAPLANGGEQFVTTVQEVKISPNKAAAEIVAAADRSVVGLVVKDAVDGPQLAVGVVVTNDGLVVTSAKLPATDLVAVDWRGITMPVRLVGKDEFYGLTYLRLVEGVLSPLDVRSEEVPVGNELLLVSRAAKTGLLQVHDWRVNEWVLPPELGPSGLQRLLKGESASGLVEGGVLLDEETKLAGVVSNSQAGLVLGGDHLLASIQRVAGGQREVDPLENKGLSVHYAFITDSERGRRFAAEVVTVEKGSWADQVGLKARDVLVNIDGEELNWGRSVANQLAGSNIKQVTVQRKGEKVELVVKGEN